jgi:hypothetical protein
MTMAETQFPIPPLHVESFQTREEFAAHLEKRRQAERQADAMIAPWQAALTWGDKVCYEFRYDDGTPITIYYAIKRSPYKEDHYHEDEMWPRRVSGWGYSVFCPDGEPGSTHRSAFERKLTEAEWATAMAEIQGVHAVRSAVLK